MQEAVLIVMRVEHRQLLLAMHNIEGISDIECHRGGRLVIAGAIQRHHGPISLITSRKLGAFSQRDMVGCEHRSCPLSGR